MSESPITVASALFHERSKRAQPLAIISSSLNDSKFRDSALKFSSQLLKLSAYYADNQTDKKVYTSAVAQLGVARRFIRFLRWIPNAANLTKNIYSTESHLLVLKSIHYSASVCGGVCEDVVTLQKLNIAPYNADVFDTIRKYSVFIEACSGAVLTLFLIRQEQKRYRDLVRASAGNNATKNKDQLVAAYISLHLQQMNAVKWFLEVFAQSYGFEIHNFEALSIIAGLLSSGDALYSSLFRSITTPTK